MRIYSVFFLPVALTLTLTCARAQTACTAERMDSLARTLPSDSAVRLLIAAGNKGSGTRLRWMEGMRQMQVRQAMVQLDYSWSLFQVRFSHVRTIYWKEIENFDPASSISDPATLARIEATGLAAELREYAKTEAAYQLSEIIGQTPYRTATGRISITLLDDECYPEVGVSPTVEDPDFSKLMRAAADGNLTSVMNLVKQGSNVNARDQAGRTALMYAIVSRDLDVVSFLLHSGANPNVRDLEGRTPLIVAAGGSGPKVVSLLLASGADVNARSNSGRTALMEAAGARPLEVMPLLMAKADVNAQDANGMTALMEAAWKGDPDVVRSLLAAHADVTLRNKKGESALTIARERRIGRQPGHDQVVAILESASRSQ